MADALPGQYYRNTVRDRRGNAIASVVVEVLVSGTATLITTVETDEDGWYAIPLTGDLEDRLLVDLRFSGPITTYTLSGITLL